MAQHSRLPILTASAMSLALFAAVPTIASAHTTIAQAVRAGSTQARRAATSYKITDLGTLPGQTTSYAGDIALVGATPNSSGQASGVSEGGAATAVFFGGGHVTNINTLGADVSLGFGINAAGQIVGKEIKYSDPCTCFHAYLYTGGSMKVIDSASQFPSGGEAYAINGSGTIVGVGYLSSSNFHAFVYSGGKMTDIGGGYQARAIAINDSGEVIGNGTDLGAFKYVNGNVSALGVPKGATATSAFGLNSTGQIAGGIYLSGSGAHGGLYNNGTWTDLGSLPGAISTLAFGVNTGGQVVGVAFFPNTYHPFKAGKHVALIFSNGKPVDLDTLISPMSGYTLTDAVGINDAGQILCNATNAAGAKHAVLLSPK